MSEIWHDLTTYQTCESEAVRTIAQHLKQGKLALFLGSGVSDGVGLPGWEELVERCCHIKNVDYEVNDLESSMELVRRECEDGELHKTIHEALYENFDDKNIHKLLYAIGAMMSGDARGRVSEIITLNFDDVLERYLTLHGYRYSVVKKFPTLLRGDHTKIYHPHGFIPFKEIDDIDGSDIIFDQLSFDSFLSVSNRSPWVDYVNQMIETKMVLAIGLGVSDQHLMSTFGGLAEKYAGMRPSAFWLLRNNTKKVSKLNDRNIAAIEFEDYDDIPEFLLKVCRCAALSD